MSTVFSFLMRANPKSMNPGIYRGPGMPPAGNWCKLPMSISRLETRAWFLVDDCGVRATMTASWLNQMGMPHVYVLESGWERSRLETGPEPVTVLGGMPQTNWIDAAGLAADDNAVVIDFARSLTYRAGHVPGAFWGSRGSIPVWLQELPDAPHYIISADQDAMTALCVADLARHTDTRVSGLRGGYPAWRTAGLATESGLERTLATPEDAYHRPMTASTGKRGRCRITWIGKWPWSR